MPHLDTFSVTFSWHDLLSEQQKKHEAVAHECCEYLLDVLVNDFTEGPWRKKGKNTDLQKITYVNIWLSVMQSMRLTGKNPCQKSGVGSEKTMLYTGRLPSRFQMWTNVSWTWPTLANTAVNTNVSMWLEVTRASAGLDTGSTLISAPAEVSSLTSCAQIFEVSKWLVLKCTIKFTFKILHKFFVVKKEADT